MPLVRDLAICLRRVDYSETSQVLAIFAREHGNLRVIAKGAKRTTKAGSSKFDGGLDLLDLGQAVFIHSPEKDISTLTEWTLESGHLELRQSLRSLYLAQYAGELVSILFEEHDPHPDVFDDLAAVLPELATPRIEEVFLAFQLRLLFSAGLLPELRHCISCNRPLADNAPAYFAPSSGGVLCRDCEPAHPDRLTFDPRLIRLTRNLGLSVLPRSYTAPKPPLEFTRLPRLTRAQTDIVNRILLEHLRYLTHRNPRMADFILRHPSGRPSLAYPALDEPPLPPLPVAPPPLDPPDHEGSAAALAPSAPASDVESAPLSPPAQSTPLRPDTEADSPQTSPHPAADTPTTTAEPPLP